MDTKKKAFIIALLRRGTYKWRPRNETLSEARVERGRYKCNVCENIVGRKEVQVDHIEPCIDPTKGWESFDSFLDKLFCEKNNLQAICKPCHKIKSTNEMSVRKTSRAKKNEKL